MLNARRWQVYRWLFKNGPATAQELENSFLDMGLPEGIHAHKRLPELRDTGVVTELGITICRITGRNVILWDVTENLPKKIESDRIIGRTRKQLIQYIKTLQLKIKELQNETIEYRSR